MLTIWKVLWHSVYSRHCKIGSISKESVILIVSLETSSSLALGIRMTFFRLTQRFLTLVLYGFCANQPYLYYNFLYQRSNIFSYKNARISVSLKILLKTAVLKTSKLSYCSFQRLLFFLYSQDHFYILQNHQVFSLIVYIFVQLLVLSVLIQLRLNYGQISSEQRNLRCGACYQREQAIVI